MSRFFLIAIFLFGLATLYAENVVETTGYGNSEFQAQNDALRNAVEKGAGIKIFSETVVKDFVALKDVLVAQAFGMVTSYKVLDKGEKDGQYWVKVNATVSPDVEKNWAQMRPILEQKGRPSVMFCLKEILDGQEMVNPTGEYQMVQKFKDMGFKTIDRQWFEKTKDLHKQTADIEKNMDAIIALGKQQGANLVVVGVLEGTFNGYEEYVSPVVMHSYNLKTKIIWTDTAEVVGSITQPYSTRYSSITYNRETAGKAGFAEIIRDKYIQPMMVDILNKWIIEIDKGADMLLVVSNVSFSMRKPILDTLQKMPELITWIQVNDYRNKRLELNIRSKLSAEALAEKMETIQGLKLEVVELKKNWLEVKFIGN